MNANSTTSLADVSTSGILAINSTVDFQLVYVHLREEYTTAQEDSPIFTFVWSDDESSVPAVWSDSQRLTEYLENFHHAAIRRRQSDRSILELTLIPENGHMPADAVLSKYVFVSVETLFTMLFPPSHAAATTVADIAATGSPSSSEGSSSSTTTLTSNQSIESVEYERCDYCGLSDEYDCGCSNMLFRFPHLPHHGLHGFNLFVPPLYAVGQTIGEGEFATICLASNIETQKAVAIKMFRHRRYPAVNEQIMREIETLKGLSCPNIIKVFETIIHGENTFMVMELMYNGDLRRYINRNGRLSEALSRKLFLDCLSGVAYLHRRNIVHLDLKLENLLLDEDMCLKISDFGCARMQMGQKTFSTPCGSYAYGAPEVISGQSFDGKKADIWSMGVILYCMVMAKLPFSDESDLCQMLLERRLPPKMDNLVSPLCKVVVFGMLTYRRESRLTLQQVMGQQWLNSNTPSVNQNI